MKYMILLYDNADMREIFSSRSDLMEEMDGLPGFLTLQITRSALLMGHPRWCLDRRRERAKTACPVQGLKQTSPSRRSVRCRKRQQDVAPVEGLIHERPQRYLLVGAL